MVLGMQWGRDRCREYSAGECSFGSVSIMEKRRSLSSGVDFVAFWRDFFGEVHLSWRASQRVRRYFFWAATEKRNKGNGVGFFKRSFLESKFFWRGSCRLVFGELQAV